MMLRCPFTKEEKRRVIQEAIKALSFIYNGNGGNLIKELAEEWRKLSHEILDLKEQQNFKGYDLQARIYVLEQKRETVSKLIEDLKFPDIPDELIEVIAVTKEVSTYDIIKRVLITYIDISKGTSKPKALAAMKSAIASDLNLFGYSKVESQNIAKHIAWAIFEDSKGVDFPRKSKTYKSKYIHYHIFNWDEINR